MADHISPEIGQVIADPEQFIRAGQFLNDVQVAHLPADFQAKAFVNAAVLRDGSFLHVSAFQAGDTFQGWSSGIAVSHKDDDLANGAGLAGILRNPPSASLDDALDQAHVLGPVSLDREQRDSLFLNMKGNTYPGALDYLKPMEHWAMGAGLSMKELQDQERGVTVPAERVPSMETIGDAPGAKSIAELAGRGAAIGGMGPHPGEGPKQPSPMGGLDMAGMAEGATVLYSRADAPDTLRTGVLMHNQDTANGQRLEMLNDQGLRERLYTGPDQGQESPQNRMAAVLGYATPTTEPLFVAGVGADGKIAEKPQDAQSFGVFFHDKNGEAVPAGQAMTADLAERLKTHIEQGRVPEPVEAPKTLASLGALRDLLDLPPEAPKLEAENKNAEPKKPDLKKPEFTPPDPSKPDEQPKNPQQQQVVHQRIGLLSALLMHTANAGRRAVRAIRGPDAEEWQHRAHAHMDRAQAHMDAIARHPAVQEYQKMEGLQGMPERAKALYAETLMRNNPDLAAHYAQAKDSVEKSHDAMFYMNKKGGKTDPALTEKAGKVYETASKLSDMESGSSSGLFSSLKSFFSAQQTQTMRKP
jgi:hypothetical protein